LYDEQQTDDLFQEILIEIWRSIEKFRHQSKWNTYIYRIAVNTAIKYNAKLKKSRIKTTKEVPTTTIEEKIILEKQFKQMYNAIQQLKPTDRLLISLVLEDLSYKEIAEILNSKVNLIGVRINRIKQRIIKIIEKENA
jgi:RNA polymerase sigma-70 factor (ECF subfamily)